MFLNARVYTVCMRVHACVHVWCEYFPGSQRRFLKGRARVSCDFKYLGLSLGTELSLLKEQHMAILNQ